MFYSKSIVLWHNKPSSSISMSSTPVHPYRENFLYVPGVETNYSKITMQRYIGYQDVFAFPRQHRISFQLVVTNHICIHLQLSSTLLVYPVTNLIISFRHILKWYFESTIKLLLYYIFLTLMLETFCFNTLSSCPQHINYFLRKRYIASEVMHQRN